MCIWKLIWSVMKKKTFSDISYKWIRNMKQTLHIISFFWTFYSFFDKFWYVYVFMPKGLLVCKIVYPGQVYDKRLLWAESFKSELAKISELRNKWIKNSKNGLLLNLFGFSSDFDETCWSFSTHGCYNFTKF